MKITGKTLVEMGYRPGAWFREALDYLASAESSENEMKAYLDDLQPNHVFPHETAIPFYQNIEAENEEEQKNVDSVLACMREVMKTATVVTGAVMPDACPTGGKAQIPVGGVVVSRDAIHPAMHSADVCCSVMLSSLGDADPKAVLDSAFATTHFGPGGREDLFPFPEELAAKMKGNYFLSPKNMQMVAKSHLGTQGDGNHFLYVGTLESSGETVMVTHHGSRGLGARLYKQGMKTAESFRRMLSPKTVAKNAWIPYSSEKGKQYWEALQIVREWTKLNHETIHNATAERIGAAVVNRFWNEHNFVFKKANLFYHAKGATPLSDEFVPDSKDGLRLIPLNMREPILIVKGESTENNLGFAPHGAGRNTSRSKHLLKKAGKSTEAVFEEETKGLDVRFFNGNVDLSELPSAYKNAKAVQEQMQTFGLGEIVDRVLPYGCIMAGKWVPLWKQKETSPSN